MLPERVDHPRGRLSVADVERAHLIDRASDQNMVLALADDSGMR